MGQSRTLKVAMVGHDFMGRAHSNAFHQVTHFFDSPFNLKLKISKPNPGNHKRIRNRLRRKGRSGSRLSDQSVLSQISKIRIRRLKSSVDIVLSQRLQVQVTNLLPDRGLNMQPDLAR